MTIANGPGVFVREFDQSVSPVVSATSIFGIVTTARKGILNSVTTVTSESGLISAFGRPGDNHYGIDAGLRYLREGNQLKVVRVATWDGAASGDPADEDDATATGVVLASVGGTEALQVTAKSAGTDGNNIDIIVSASRPTGTYRIQVRSYETVVEDYSGVVMDDDTSDYYVTTMLANSAWVIVAVLNLQTALYSSTTPVDLVGGDDGAPASTSDVIGIITGGVAQGLQMFRDPEHCVVDYFAVPGRTERSIVVELLAIAAARDDSMALIDAPFGKTVDEIVDWHNGTGGGGDDPTSALNEKRGQLCYPWQMTKDAYNDEEKWVPPSCFVAERYAYTHKNGNFWDAPAGNIRGLLSGILESEYSPTQGDRAYMYDDAQGNNVNPICNIPGQGVMIYGQKTLSREGTAFNRVNVVFLANLLRRRIKAAVEAFLWLPNVSSTWERVVNAIEPILYYVAAENGIYPAGTTNGWTVVCDENTNTAVVIAAKTMKIEVSVVPVYTAERIVLDLTYNNLATV